jgi:hypothetical protein
MKRLVFFLTLAASSFGFAARHNRAYEVARLFYEAKCDQRCQSGVTIDYYRSKDFLRLPNQVYRGLLKLAFDQAQIWGDTILEGDFVADGKTELDEVLVLKRDGRVLGYGIVYSEKAWYVGQCTYVYRNPASLAGCGMGRIAERSFVTSDLAEVEVDENGFADFHSKE